MKSEPDIEWFVAQIVLAATEVHGKARHAICMGLNLIGRPGNLVAFDFARRPQIAGLGER